MNPGATCGRFAPTPSGALHLGSLVAALGSHLAARRTGGRWLVRIEDLDAPRALPAAADHILQALELHGLEWDGPVLRQSLHGERYREARTALAASGLCYPCACSRTRIARHGLRGAEGWTYPGTCRAGLPPGGRTRTWRARTDAAVINFTDLLRGPVTQALEPAFGDFVIWRTEDIAAYHLAAVVDDAYQGVTQVVRGADLLGSTPRQIHLQRLLRLPTPDYAHLPLVLGRDGRKLGKSNGARALDLRRPEANLRLALGVLGHTPPPELQGAPAHELIAWARAHFTLRAVPVADVPAPQV